ncbi:DUF3180 domain-containing protein [Kocuria coralli]|nr:DUF3180 domain-containing protein [Kocuria coralli]
MKYLSLRLLLLLAALSFTASWAAGMLSARLGGPLLSLPWAAGIALLVEAAVLLIVGLKIRKIRDGDREVRLDRTWGAVTASLAQANAVVGAMLAGWHGLLVVSQLTLLSVRSHHGPLWLAIGMTVIGVVLCVIGWIVEGFCRLPPEDDDEAGGSSGRTRPRPAQEGGMARTRDNPPAHHRELEVSPDE